MKHAWGRSQKYHDRQRYLYALLFENGCAYIGQTVDLKAREQQHRRSAGGWCGKPFKCVALASFDGTEEQAKEHEHAWRHKAADSGWNIYGKPPSMIVNHHKQMNIRRYLIATQLRWPARHRRKGPWIWKRTAACATALFLVAWFL